MLLVKCKANLRRTELNSYCYMFVISKGVYLASYSLHDGDDDCKEGESPCNDRQLLKKEWARFGRCFKYQPYELIKDYFGTEVC
jgi:hypothetical protein